MDSLSITFTNKLAIDGIIFAANSASLSPEAFAEQLLLKEGKRYADSNRFGVITSAAFVGRFTPAEYSAIKTEAETNAQVQGLLDELYGSPNVAFDDERVTNGLALLVSLGLITSARVDELLSYDRPTPAAV